MVISKNQTIWLKCFAITTFLLLVSAAIVEVAKPQFLTAYFDYQPIETLKYPSGSIITLGEVKVYEGTIWIVHSNKFYIQDAAGIYGVYPTSKLPASFNPRKGEKYKLALAWDFDAQRTPGIYTLYAVWAIPLTQNEGR